jgi:hypothetical protein
LIEVKLASELRLACRLRFLRAVLTRLSAIEMTRAVSRIIAPATSLSLA